MTRRPGKAPTFWQVLEQYPPFFVRLYAKRPGSGRGRNLAIEDAELGIISGLPLTRIRQIAQSTDWDGVTIGEMKAFTRACNFDPMLSAARRRVCQYNFICQKRNVVPFQYLRSAPKWESEFLPLLQLLKSRLGSSGKFTGLSSPKTRSAA